MKKESKMRGVLVAGLTVLAIAGRGVAATLDVDVDPTTWEIVGTSYPVNGQDQQASHTDSRGNVLYRYYTYGAFAAVNIWNVNDHSAPLESLDGCNNIFYIDRAAHWGYLCNTGYNGTGNGTSGSIDVAKAFSNGDLYIGGSFPSAGGWGNSANFSCFRWTEGWSGVNGISASDAVTGMSFNGVYQLQVYVSGPNPCVRGPLSSGGGPGELCPPFGTPPLWNEWHLDFPSGYWSD